MANTLILLDEQAESRVFSFGTTSASGEANVNFYNGTAALTNVVSHVWGSQTVEGNLNVIGDLNITGAINEQTVNNLNVKDKTISVNNGGTTALAGGSGLIVEGDSNATIAQISYAAASATKFQIGDGTTQVDIIDISTIQTLTNKTINATNNTITDTATVLGDLLKSNGTKFLKFALGSALQNLRVNAAGTDVEYYTLLAVQRHQPIVISGTQNGVNKTFTLASAPTGGVIQLFKNGQLLTPGSGKDYQLSGVTITFETLFPAPLVGTQLTSWGTI